MQTGTQAAHTVVAAAFLMLFAAGARAQRSASAAQKTLVAVFAHDDDEGMVGPILARYAREGAQVYLVLATDGAQGGRHTTIPRGPELARAREQEARCAADALGIRPPVFLAFPDGKLGDYVTDPSAVYRLAQRVAEELQRLKPDAIITFGPDGATGHPDHRIVGDVVAQLARAGAPGVPDRIFYAMIPAEGLQAMNPQRGAPPLLVPQSKYFSVRVPFTAPDLEAAHRSMSCHKTQYSDEVVQQIFPLQAQSWHGAITLAPAPGTAATSDLFH